MSAVKFNPGEINKANSAHAEAMEEMLEGINFDLEDFTSEHENFSALNAPERVVAVGNTQAEQVKIETAKKSPEELLKEEGEKAAAKLTATWKTLPQGVRSTAEFAAIADLGENVGEKLLANELQIAEQGNSSEEEKNELRKQAVRIVETFRDRAVQARKDFNDENDAVRKRIAKNNEKIEEEKERKLEELGSGEIKRTTGSDEPEKSYPGNENVEQRIENEKREGWERMDKLNDRDPMKTLENEVVECRNMYASVEYNNRSALESIRKFFGSKKHEDTAEVKAAKDQYLKKLERFKTAKIEELKTKNLSDEELKKEMGDLVKEFGCMEAVHLFNARTDAKADKLMTKDVFKKCWGYAEKITNKYNKLPFWAKFSISAGVLASGAGFLIGGKRILSGIFFGVGTAKMLDALHQGKMKRDAGKDTEEMFAGFEEGSDKFKALNELLDSKISKVDDQLNKQKFVSLANKFIGIAAGITVGSGALARVTHGWFSAGKTATANPNLGIDYDKFREFAGFKPGAASGMVEQVHTANPVSAVIEQHSLGAETLTVHEGSSFIGTLKHSFLEQHRDEFIKMHPEYARLSNDQIAYRLAQAYGNKHLDGNLPDFVKAGAKMSFDPHTMEVHFLKPGDVGDASRFGLSHSAPAVSELAPKAPVQEVLQNSNVVEAKKMVSMQNMVDESIQKHTAAEALVKQHSLASAHENFVKAHSDYVSAADSYAGSGNPTPEQLEEIGRANKAMQQAVEYIKNNSDFYTQTAKRIDDIQKAIAASDRGLWNEVQNLEYDKAVADGRVGNNLKMFKEAAEKEFGRRHAFTPKNGETVRLWTMRVAARLMEKKYDIAA